MMRFYFNGLVSPESVVMDTMRDQINLGSAYTDIGGLTVAQHAWLLAWQASLIRGSSGPGAIAFADSAFDGLHEARNLP